MKDFDQLVQSLARFPAVLSGLVGGLSEEQFRWKPPSGNWAIVEILRHIEDEELDDFRTRVEMTLRDPSQPWPPIDPPAKAIECNYIAADPWASLKLFTQERAKSVEFLEGLSDPDWERAYEHPAFGPISAGRLMTSWAAHDFLHARQITKRMFEMCQVAGAPYATDYAGEWTA